MINLNNKKNKLSHSFYKKTTDRKLDKKDNWRYSAELIDKLLEENKMHYRSLENQIMDPTRDHTNEKIITKSKYLK